MKRIAMRRKRKLSELELAPEEEAENLFIAMERWRKTVHASHDMIILLGNDVATSGWTPEGCDLAEFQRLVAQALKSPGATPPPVKAANFIGDYKGFFLADPFSDRSPVLLEDISDFSSTRPFFDIYTVNRGTLKLRGSDACYHAQELEEWVSKKWLNHRGSLTPDW